MNQTEIFDAIIFMLPYEKEMYWKYKVIAKIWSSIANWIHVYFILLILDYQGNDWK